MLLLNDHNRFELEIRDGHLLIEIGGRRALIDTGSPISLGYGAEIDFLEKTWQLQPNMTSTSFEEIVSLLGFEIDVLLGMDVLANFHLEIRSSEREIVFHAERPDLAGEMVELEFCMSVPVLKVNIDGRICKAFFDTGAARCYFAIDTVGGYAAGHTAGDFYPGFGAFETQVREVPVGIGRGTYKMETGTLPRLLHDSLLLAEVDGVVGTPLLYHCNVCLSFPDGLISLL